MTRYRGILARPIRLGEGADWEREHMKRWDALAKHYGVNLGTKGGMAKLALLLAHAHVPGFRVEIISKPPSGRKTSRDLALIAHVYDLVSGRGMSKRSAARHIARTRPELGLSAEAARVRVEQLLSPTRSRDPRIRRLYVSAMAWDKKGSRR